MLPDYHMPLWRPPGEAENLILQATIGCSFNQCSFCAMYRSKQYRVRPLTELFAEIDACAHDWPEAQRIFLGDGDALALPADHLSALLDKLATVFPRLTRVSCYATPSNLLRKSEAELEHLRRRKLSLLYVGIESGADAILRKVTKGATQRSIAEALHKAHAAGMKVSATVILGLGGTTHAQEHIDGTVELLNSAPLTQLSTLQLYLDSCIEADFRQRYGEPFDMPDDHALLREQQRLIAGIDPPRPLLFRSNHASNALALAGNLPRDRQRLLYDLEAALRGERGLRPHHLRSM